MAGRLGCLIHFLKTPIAAPIQTIQASGCWKTIYRLARPTRNTITSEKSEGDVIRTGANRYIFLQATILIQTRIDAAIGSSEKTTIHRSVQSDRRQGALLSFSQTYSGDVRYQKFYIF